MSDERANTRWTSVEPPADEEAVRRLLVSAGHRPAVPAEDLAAIRAAARREWEGLVAVERRRRLRRSLPLALAASLIAALAVGWWWFLRDGAPPAPAVRVATVELVKGAAGLAPGASLTAGSELATAAGDRVALRLAGGESVRLDGGTRLRLASRDRLELLGGAVYVDSGGGPAGAGALVVGTPFGDVREIGTQFEVRMRPGGETALRVRVREGAVSLRRRGAADPVAAGGELALRRDGSLRRGNVEPHGPAWDWVLAAAPSFELEGATLRDYLRWVSRETAWRLQYEDAALAELAATIRLHGSIEEMAPDESVGVVLPGSGLDYRVEGGALRITR